MYFPVSSVKRAGLAEKHLLCRLKDRVKDAVTGDKLREVLRGAFTCTSRTESEQADRLVPCLMYKNTIASTRTTTLGQA